MPLLADLQAAFAEPEITLPVQYGASVTRGFRDRTGSAQHLLGLDVEVAQDVLYVVRDALPGLADDTLITVGLEGADTVADGAEVLRILSHRPVEDGLIIAIALGGSSA